MNVVSHTEEISVTKYTISSAGYDVRNDSSIVMNGTEYSQNVRGLNIVVVENSEVRIQSVLIHTVRRLQ